MMSGVEDFSSVAFPLSTTLPHFCTTDQVYHPYQMAAPGETYRLAFPSKSKPWISMGIPFQDACAHHVTNTFHASRVYIIVSSSISKTENFAVLHKALGDKVIGVSRDLRFSPVHENQ